MKKSFTIFTLLAFSIFLNWSCEDLEEDPVGLLAPEGFFKSPEDVALGINGGYSLLNYESFWGRKIPLSLLLRGDMATIGDMGTASRRIEIDQMNMSVDNGMVTEFWPRVYEALAALNYSIEGGEALGVADEEINPTIAEGRFLRAFLNYHLVRMFGEVPLIDFAFTDASIAYTIPQASEDAIYASIIDDLEFGKLWLPDQASVRSRPSKGTAAAYLASVYLTTEEWQLAYDEAKYVIDNSGIFQYNLEGEFADLFDASITTSSNEVLFELNMIGNDSGTNPGSLGGTNATADYMAPVTGVIGDERYSFGAGWGVAVPSMLVYNTWDSRDYRKSVSFDTVMINGGVEVHYTNWGTISNAIPRPHIAKYYRALGQSETDAGANGRDSGLDIPFMRYAEVLLIAAEALNEVNQGSNAEAEGYVNEVRSRARRELDTDTSNDTAYPQNVTSGLGLDAFRDLVLEERRLELAFEGGRWYDIKRRQMGSDAFGASGLEPQSFNPSRDYLFPKYQQDVDLNPNLDQNDNY